MKSRGIGVHRRLAIIGRRLLRLNPWYCVDLPEKKKPASIVLVGTRRGERSRRRNFCLLPESFGDRGVAALRQKKGGN